MKAKTIDEVIQHLDEIIESSKNKNSYLGYFPALYRKVTIRVKEGIEKVEFEDGPRMEKLDVIFANRYLEAYYRYQSDLSVTRSWAFAFKKSKNWWPLTIQHLLWGINAHINLDLGIAAVETVGDEPLDSLKNDFDKINEVLAELVNEVQEELSEIWPFLKVLLKLSGKLDDKLINFSMKLARDGAWKFAQELNLVSGSAYSEIIDQRDVRIEQIAEFVYPKNILIRILFGIIRLSLRKSIRERIETLE